MKKIIPIFSSPVSVTNPLVKTTTPAECKHQKGSAETSNRRRIREDSPRKKIHFFDCQGTVERFCQPILLPRYWLRWFVIRRPVNASASIVEHRFDSEAISSLRVYIFVRKNCLTDLQVPERERERERDFLEGERDTGERRGDLIELVHPPSDSFTRGTRICSRVYVSGINCVSRI